jgi:hypothetical protein
MEMSKEEDEKLEEDEDRGNSQGAREGSSLDHVQQH